MWRGQSSSWPAISCSILAPTFAPARAHEKHWGCRSRKGEARQKQATKTPCLLYTVAVALLIWAEVVSKQRDELAGGVQSKRRCGGLEGSKTRMQQALVGHRERPALRCAGHPTSDSTAVFLLFLAVLASRVSARVRCPCLCNPATSVVRMRRNS